MSTILSTKFVRLLQSLQPEEIKAFGKWLRSPWCNSNKNLIRLFDQLKKYYPHFNDQKLTKEQLFMHVLPKGKFSDRRMNNLFSEGYQAAESFLIHQQLSQDHHLRDDLLLAAWQGHHLNDWFFKASDRQIAQLKKQDVRSWEEHLVLFRRYRQYYHHPNQDIRMQLGHSPLVEMNQQLDLLYLLEKAAIINEKMTRNRVLHQEDHEVAAELKKWEAVAIDVRHPTIDLYRMRFAYSPDNRLPHYWQLRSMLLVNWNQISQKDRKIHLLSLINDTMQLIKSGQLDITESLPLYKLGLTSEVLLHHGRLTRNTYSMIVMAANTKGDFAFTEHFIETRTRHLDETIRDDYYHWAKAHTAYWKKDLESSLRILQEHPFKAPYFQLICRVLNTQVYFDLYLQDDSYEFFLFNYLDAFEKWLSRDKLWSVENKTAFVRFVQKCRLLAKYYGEVDFPARKVEGLLEDIPNIQALNWLQLKQNEILAARST